MANNPEKKQTGRPKTFNRQEVIEHSMHKYWKDGVQQTSLNDVCRWNQISKPSLYREFGGEDGLLDSVVDYYSQLWLTPITEIIQMDRPFLEGLNEYLSYVTNPDHFPHGCLVVNMIDEFDQLGPQTQERLTSLQTMSRNLYREWVERGISADELRSDMEMNHVVYFIEVQFWTVLRLMAKKDPPSLIRQQALLAFESLFSNSQ